MTPVLRLAGVTKRFASPAGAVEVLRGVDADLRVRPFFAQGGDVAPIVGQKNLP